ncbi:MAG: hypothetical protein WCG25_00565 [bacterium]
MSVSLYCLLLHKNSFKLSSFLVLILSAIFHFSINFSFRLFLSPNTEFTHTHPPIGTTGSCHAIHSADFAISHIFLSRASIHDPLLAAVLIRNRIRNNVTKHTMRSDILFLAQLIEKLKSHSDFMDEL